MNSFDQERIRGIFNSVRDVVEKMDRDAANDFVRLMDEKIHDTRPSIIVYGIYNHGKSTLVNALLGEKAAKTANRPTTDTVDQYHWKGYSICDTPGIDAPIEHEAIAEKKLHESEVVLFVLESGSMEIAKVWDAIASMIRRGQHVCLIVNDRTDCMSRPQEYTRLKDAYLYHLQEALAQDSGDISKVEVFFVNAYAAQKAKLENKLRLLDASGLPVLEAHLEKFFAALPVGEFVKTLERNLSDLLTRTRLRIVEQSGDPRLESAEKSFARIEHIEKSLRLDVDAELQRRTRPLEADICNVLRGVQNPDAARNALAPMMEKLGADISAFMKDAFQKAALEVEGVCQRHDQNIRGYVDVFVDMPPEENDHEGSSLLNLAAKQISWESVLDGAQFENLVREGVVKVLQWGKNIFPSLFKGMGPKAMATWGARVFAVIGPLITVATAFWELYSSYKQEEKERMAAQRREKMLTDAAKELVEQIRSEFSSQINAVISDIFLPVKRQLAQQLDALRLAARDTARALKAIDMAQEMISGGSSQSEGALRVS